MRKSNNPFLFVLTSVIKSYLALFSAVYLGLIGVSAFNWFITGAFHFNFHDKLILCLEKSILPGVLLGVGDCIMRKARKFEEDKKNNRSKF